MLVSNPQQQYEGARQDTLLPFIRILYCGRSSVPSLSSTVDTELIGYKWPERFAVYLAALRAVRNAACLELKDPGSQLLACLARLPRFHFFCHYIILSCPFELPGLLQSSSNHQSRFAPHRQGEPRHSPTSSPHPRSRSLSMAPAASCKFKLSTILVSTGSSRPATDSIHPSVHPSVGD